MKGAQAWCSTDNSEFPCSPWPHSTYRSCSGS